MKKILKWFAIILLAVFGVLLYIANLPHYNYPTFFDVVMVEGQLYFVLEKEVKVYGLRVEVKPDDPSKKSLMEMWGFGDYYSHSPHHIITRRQIKYGEKLEGFSVETQPKELQRLEIYKATVNSSAGGSPGCNEFTIINDNKVVMPFPSSPEGRPKKRTIIIDKNGKKVTVPYSVSFDKNGNKTIVPRPVPEN